ncbi:MAG: VacJ family lipoprotein [Succinivibrio sp.]
MFRKNLFTVLTATVALYFMSSLSQAYAAHSSYGPMAPRQISLKSSKADYSYGLSVLPGNSIDSLEPVNRYAMWYLNYNIIDRYFLRPVAHGYAKLPKWTRTSVHNFCSNLDDINNIVNNALIGEFSDSTTSLGRFSINSTIGLLGFIDVASYLGLEKKAMSMNTVLGKAGSDQGTFFMVPFYGPASQRSMSGNYIDSWPFFPFGAWPALAVGAIEGLDQRAALIPQEEIIDKAVDPYAQTRQIYLMYQEGLVNPEAAMKVSEDENLSEFLDEIDE